MQTRLRNNRQTIQSFTKSLCRIILLSILRAWRELQMCITDVVFFNLFNLIYQWSQKFFMTPKQIYPNVEKWWHIFCALFVCPRCWVGGCTLGGALTSQEAAPWADCLTVSGWTSLQLPRATSSISSRLRECKIPSHAITPKHCWREIRHLHSLSIQHKFPKRSSDDYWVFTNQNSSLDQMAT